MTAPALAPHGPFRGEWEDQPVDPAPRGVPDELVEVPENFRTATGDGLLRVSGLHPTPYVRLNFTDLGPSVSVTGGLPSGQVVLDGLAVEWGQEDTLSQPDPSTATFTVLDFTLTWAAGSALLGLPVQFRWVLVRPEFGISKVRSFFEGRVSGVNLQLVTVQLANGYTVQATRVEVSCTSVEVDDANRTLTGAWPEETIDQRSLRIGNLLGKSVTYRNADWGTGQAKGMNVNGASPRDLLLQFYNSTGGDRLAFSTQALTYQAIGRRVASGRRTAGYLVAGTFLVDGNGAVVDPPAYQARYGKGIYVLPSFRFAPTLVEDSPMSIYLDAGVLEYGEGVRKTASERITRVAVDYEEAGVKTTIVKVDAAANEALIGQRSVTLDSLHVWNAWADLNGRDLLAMATQEGAQWAPGTLRWDTRKTNGFESSTQCDVLMRGYATRVPIWVARSDAATLGVRPLFTLIGGRIAYERGAWVVDMTLAGWSTNDGGNATPTPVKQHPLTWEEVDDGTAEWQMEWHDEEHARAFHETVTYEDMAFVGTGWGDSILTYVGPDTGWDFYA